MRRPTVVVDASVAVKWVLPWEEDQQKAFVLQDLYRGQKLDLIAPYLLISEVANVIGKHVSRGTLTPLAASRCLAQLFQDSPNLLDSPRVHRSALELAMAHGPAVYDCLYLAWALEQRCDLITADRRFYEAVGLAFSCVRLLSDWTFPVFLR